MKPETKKKITVWGIFAALVVVLVCGTVVFHHFRTTVNLEKLTTHLLSSSLYYQNMEEIPQNDIAEHYGIDASDIVESIAYTASDDTAREFAVFKAVSVDAAGDMMDAFTQYSLLRMDEYSGKNSEEYERVKGYVINRTGEYVFFTISDQNGTGRAAVQEYLDSTLYDKTR